LLWRARPGKAEKTEVEEVGSGRGAFRCGTMRDLAWDKGARSQTKVKVSGSGHRGLRRTRSGCAVGRPARASRVGSEVRRELLGKSKVL
jgi:hypothetical protein